MMTNSEPSTGRRLLLGLELLDRQIVDRHGRLAGKVDDVELTAPEGGGAPLVTALVSGRGALAQRLGGRIGRVTAALSRRLIPEHGDPGRIWIGHVSGIGNHIDVAGDADQLATHAVERALRSAIVARIPGSRSSDAVE
ncbi:MAG TPA: hypothetical protein VJM75_04305 [Acidimicrobiales bacterium]|jgi:hypothetical protein|nr:hypothetical protein [Acidimicrobiales bacterium]